MVSDAGRVLILDKGNWNTDSTYEVLDSVIQNRTRYISKVNNNKGISPMADTEQNNWCVLAYPGIDGEGSRMPVWNTGTAIASKSTGVTGAEGTYGDLYVNTSEHALYECKISGNVTTATWDFVCDLGGDSIAIVDNLDSDSSTSALSAKQGKILNGKIEDLERELQTSLGDISTALDAILGTP